MTSTITERPTGIRENPVGVEERRGWVKLGMERYNEKEKE